MLTVVDSRTRRNSHARVVAVDHAAYPGSSGLENENIQHEDLEQAQVVEPPRPIVGIFDRYQYDKFAQLRRSVLGD